MAGSRWARVDLGYLGNPKIRVVGPTGALLHLASILHCAEHLTDGDIESTSLRHVADAAFVSPRWARARAGQLVDAGLWIPTEHGWHLHDFEDANPQAMRAVVEDQRKRWRLRQQQHRAGGGDDVTP